MARVVIVGPSQPSRTPRLVRNADALAEAGHDVVVVTPVFEPDFVSFDESLTRSASWDYVPVPIMGSRGRVRFRERAVRRLSQEVLKRMPAPTLAAKALMYGASALEEQLRRLDGDLYLGQQQATFPLVAKVASARKRPFACDVEDILGESTAEPSALIKALEARYLPLAALVSTMSDAAASYLAQSYLLRHPVITLHNCPKLAERGTLQPPSNGTHPPAIYWFGQTLGPHSLAVELIEANARVGNPFRIRLRGRPVPAYVERVMSAAARANAERFLDILPIVDPSRMVIEAATSDILFGSQPGREPFNDLAVGNKIFTGLLAGCAVLASDTTAHRRLARSLEGCMMLVDHSQGNALQEAISRLASSPSTLLSMRTAAWNAASERFHWEAENKNWLNAIQATLDAHHP